MASTITEVALVRYGAVPEVARFATTPALSIGRGARVIVRTVRGLELGTVLELLQEKAPAVSEAPHDHDHDHGHHHDHDHDHDATEPDSEPTLEAEIIRRATPEDDALADELRRTANGEFAAWRTRIAEWGLQLELIDLEWTIDREKLVLYVLGDRGPDSTQLSLYAATAGLPPVEVQPVNADGPIPIAPGGGGHGGCGCGA